MPEESDKCRIRVNFHFQEICLHNLQADWPGKAIFVSWKRGEHKGSSRRQVVSQEEMLFMDNFSVPATLTDRGRSRGKDPKYMSFTVMLINSTATSSGTDAVMRDSAAVAVAKGVLDLSLYASAGVTHKASLPLNTKGVPKSSSQLLLEITFTCEWAKLNKQEASHGHNRSQQQTPCRSLSSVPSFSLMMPSSASAGVEQDSDCFPTLGGRLDFPPSREEPAGAELEVAPQYFTGRDRSSSVSASSSAHHEEVRRKSSDILPFLPRLTKSLSHFVIGDGVPAKKEHKEDTGSRIMKGVIRKSMTLIETKSDGDIYHLQKELLKSKKETDDLKEKVQRKKRKMKALKMELELLKKERRSRWKDRIRGEEEIALSLSQQGVDLVQREKVKAKDEKKRKEEEMGAVNSLLITIERAYKSQCHDYKQMIYWLSLASNLIKTIEREKPRRPQAAVESTNSASLESTGIILSVRSDSETKTGSSSDAITPPSLSSTSSLDLFLSRLHTALAEIFKLLLAAFYVQVEKHFMSEVFHFDEDDRASRSGESLLSRSESMTCDTSTHVQQLSEAYDYMRQCQVMPVIISQFFDHLFFYLNAKTFNSLLRDEQLVNEKTGISLKTSLSILEEWAINTDKSLLLPLVRKQMTHVKEAAILLVMPKMMLVEESSFTSLFSSLNLAQIRHLLSSFSQNTNCTTNSNNTTNKSKSNKRIITSPSDMEVVDMLRYKLDQMCSKHSFPLTLPTISLFDHALSPVEFCH